MSVQVGKAGFITKEQEIYQGGNKVNEIYVGDQMVYPATYVKKPEKPGPWYDLWRVPKKQIYNEGQELEGFRLRKFWPSGKVEYDPNDAAVVIFAKPLLNYFANAGSGAHPQDGYPATEVYFYTDWYKLRNGGGFANTINTIPLNCLPMEVLYCACYSESSGRVYILANFMDSLYIDIFGADAHGCTDGNFRGWKIETDQPKFVTTYDFTVGYLPLNPEKPKENIKDYANEFLYVMDVQKKYTLLNNFTVRVIPNEGMYKWNERKVFNYDDLIVNITELKHQVNWSLYNYDQHTFKESCLRFFNSFDLRSIWDGDKPVLFDNFEDKDREFRIIVLNFIPKYYQIVGLHQGGNVPYSKVLYYQKRSFPKPTSNAIAFLDEQFHYYPITGYIYTYEYDEKKDEWKCTENGSYFDGTTYREMWDSIYKRLEGADEFFNKVVLESDVQQIDDDIANSALRRALEPTDFWPTSSVLGTYFMPFRINDSCNLQVNPFKVDYYSIRTIWNFYPESSGKIDTNEDGIAGQVITDGV